MISIAMIALFMLISHIPFILFLIGWSYGTIQFYKLFLEDLAPMSEQTLQERQKARVESQQKINDFWNAVTGAEEGEEKDLSTHIQELKTNTETFIQSFMEEEPQEQETAPKTSLARKVSVALRKKAVVEASKNNI